MKNLIFWRGYNSLVFSFFILFLFGVNSLSAAEHANYKRIISLVPSLTQNLYYLEAQDQLVGCTSYCKAAEGDKKEIVSSAIKPNIEKIVSLKPDLVLVSTLISEKDIATLRKFGIKVEAFSSPKTFNEICLQFEKLGDLTGHSAKAKSVIADCKKRVRVIESQPATQKSKPKVFIEIGTSPIFTVIPNTFMDDFITYNGGVNISTGLKGGTIGRELVVARNPDYIFIVLMGVVGEDEKANWERFSNLNAVKNKRIFFLDSDVACLPTPITFVQTLERISSYMKR